MRGLTLSAALGAVLATAACATPGPAPETLPQVQAWLAAGGPPPPPVGQCPAVADVDLAAIAAAQTQPLTEQQARGRAFIQSLFDEMRLPPGDWRSPPAQPLVLLRSIHPPGGMHSNTMWAWVWKEADGSWWFWSQNRTLDPGQPPPPPPGPEGTPEYDAWRQAYPPGWTQPETERWPPRHGRLNPEQAALLDAALADPCRAWEPDVWPWDPPLRRPGRPGPPPPQDFAPVYVELTEPGRPPRRLAGPGGDRASLNGVLVRVAAYPRP